MSHGPVSNEPFYFAGESWVSYVAQELIYHLPADETSNSAYANYHVYMEEDEYEQDGPGSPASPNYYYRRLFWSWLLSGGSANYGGRVGGVYPYALVPYSMSGSLPWSKEGINYDNKALHGLDSAPYIASYFKNRGIKLSRFVQDDPLAADLNNNTGEARAQVARRSYDEFIIYHPNPAFGTLGRTAAPHTSRAAKFNFNLSSASGTFTTEWYNPANGTAQTGANVSGGSTVLFTAPWAGDVVLRVKNSSTTDAEIPSPSDTTKPTGSLSINSGATSTSSTSVTLTLSGADNVGVTGYYLSNNSTAPSASATGWVSVTSATSFNKTVSYTLPSGEGTKTVYAWYKDAAGNVSAAYSDSITLTTVDTTVPVITISSPTSAIAYAATQSTTNLSGTSSDAVGVTSVTWANSKGGSGTAAGTTTWSISNIALQSGDNVITVTAKDAAGNSGTDTITVNYTITSSSQGLQRIGRWFTYNDEYKYLVGLDVQEIAADLTFDYSQFLDQLEKYNINKIRLWVYCWFKTPSPDGPYLTPWQYANGKHNLDQWNSAYWQRMRNVIAAAKSRNIIVEVTIFGPNNLRKPEHWSNSVWRSAENKSFNINGVFSANAQGHFIPEYFDLNNAQLSASGKKLKDYQQALVDKTIAEFSGFNNVYFEIANEFPVSSTIDSVYPWQLHWAQRIDSSSSRLVSAHSHQFSGPHTTGIQYFWDKAYIDVMNFHFYETNPQTISNLLHNAQKKGKVLSNNESGKYFGTELDPQTRFAWAMFLSGGYFGLYCDNIVNEVGSAEWITAVKRLQILRTIAESLRFWEMSPVDANGNEYDSLITQGPSGTNKQLIANPGSEYLTYFWGSKSTTPVKITVPSGNYTFTWYDPRTGTNLLSGSLTSSGSATINAPSTTSWNEVVGVALVIRKTTTTDTTTPSVSITAPTSVSTYTTTASTINLSGTSSDNVGVASVTWSNSKGGSGTATGTTSWNISNISLMAGDNIITITAKDTAGNQGTDTLTVAYSIPAETVKPTGSISINNGVASTTSATVNLTLSATDNVGVTGYFLSNSATAPLTSATGWVSVTSAASFNKTVSYTLPSGAGTKTVYAWYKDTQGNISLTYSDSITLITIETTLPTIAIISPTSSSTYSTTQNTISLSGTASNNAGVTGVSWTNSKGGSGTATGTTSWSIANISLVAGDNVITVTAKDAANNSSTDTLTVTKTTTAASSNQTTPSNPWQQVPITTKALRTYLESKDITPAGGEGMQFIHAIAYAPSNPNIAYLGVDTDTIWKSVDGGTTWQRKGKGINSNGIVSIAVDPNNENRVFATGAQYTDFWKNSTNRSLMPLGIYRTLDGGGNWSLVKQTFYGTMGGDWGGITIAFAGANTIYAGTDEEGLLRSTDGGDTWTTVVNYSSIGRIYAVRMHPTDNSIIYIGAASGLKKVTSAGVVTNIGSGLTGVVTVVLINPNNPLIMFAGDKSNRIMKSTDGGLTFTASFTHSITAKDTAWMAMSPVDPNYVFVSFAKRTYGAGDWPKDFYYTHNASASGVTWQTAQSMDEKNQYGWVAGSLSVRFAGDSDSWSEFMGGPIAMHPTDKNIALYFAGPGVVKKTTDGGVNWRYSNAGYTAMTGMSFSLFSWDKNKVRGFATNNPDRGIYFSEDNGYTFTSYRTPYHSAPEENLCCESRGYGVAVGHGVTEDTIVGALGSHTEQIITVSKDKGNTWTQISNPNTAGDYEGKLITFSPTNPNVIYAGRFRSLDGGATWTQLSLSVDAVYWGNGDIVYSIGSGLTGIKIYKSMDRGTTWNSPYPEIPTPNNNVRRIAVSPTNPDKLYLGKRSVGVYIINGSATPVFRNENNGLLKDRWGWFTFQSIVIDPNNDKVVYVGNLGVAGHDNKTIFRSIDGGNTWETINFNLNDSGINGIGVNPHDSYVYVGTWGGIWKLPPPGTTVPPNTTPPDDTIQPVVAVTSPTTASTYVSTTSTMNLSGTASDNVGVTSITWKNSANSTSGTASGTTSWSIANISLVSGSNLITITAKDAAGNSTSDTLTVSYPAVNAPIATTSAATNVSDTSVTLNASVNPNNGSTTVWFQYGTASGSYTGLTTTQTLSGSNSLSVASTLSGLSSGKTYYYRVAAQNSAGIRYGNELSFTTTTVSDTTKPTVAITNPTTSATYTISSGTIALSGSASDNIGVTSVTWANSANNISGTASGTTSWSISNISLASGSNTITVTAKDAGGNTASRVLTVTYNPLVSTQSTTTKRTLSAITLDGQLTESVWEINNTVTKTIYGIPNNSVTFSTLWDDKYLYVGVNVLDASLRNDSIDVWQDDSVEVYIDANHNKSTTYDTYDRQFIKGYNDTSLYSRQDKTGVLHAWAAVTGYYLSTNSTIPSLSTSGWSSISSPSNFNANISYALSTGDGKKTVYVWFKDAAGNVSNTAMDSITLDSTAPVLNITSPTTGSAFTTTSDTLNLSGTTSDNTSGVAAVVWRDDISASGTASGTVTWSISGIPLSSGNNLITVTATDNAKNTTSVAMTVTYGAAPTITAGSVTNITTNSATLNETVNPNGLSTTVWFEHGLVSGFYGSQSSTQVVNGSSNAQVSIGISELSSGKTYYYRLAARNSAGTTNGTERSFTTLDTTAPTSSININDGAAYTKSTVVTLALSATDNVGVTGYYISTGATAPLASASGWTSVTSTTIYNGSVSYTLSSGDGSKTIYVWSKDAAGNVSTAAMDSITLDTTQPVVSITSPTSNSIYATTIGNITLGGTSADTTTGIAGITYTIQQATATTPGALPTGTTTTNVTRSGVLITVGTNDWSIPDIALSQGENVITVTAQDTAGNTASDTLTVSYNPDTTAPLASVSFNTDALYTSSTGITVTLYATDATGVTGYYLSSISTVPSSSSSGWISVSPNVRFNATVSYTLSGDDGQKTVYLWAKDAAGNVSSTATDSIILDTTPPNVSLSTPGAGSTISGTINVTASASDNIRLAGVQFNIDGNAFGSEDTTTPYSISLDTTNIPKGLHTLKATARDSAGHTTTSGAVTITVNNNHAPVLGTLSNKTVAEGQRLSASVPASDPDGDTLVYSAVNLPKGAILNAATGAFNWTPDYSQSGSYLMTLNVSDGSLTDSQSVTLTVTDVDNVTPSGSLSINQGSPYTHNTNVKCYLTAQDTAGVIGYYLSTSSTLPSLSASGWVMSPASTVNYSATLDYTVSSGDGLKTLYVFYKDAAGNISNAASGSITLDTHPPSITITIPTSKTTYWTKNSSLSLEGTAVDLAQVTWSNNRGGSGTATGTTSWSVSKMNLSQGENVITVTAKDRAGNIASDSVTVTYGSSRFGRRSGVRYH
ncbi:MAG TPA: hypothetical protein DD723_07295 [Candidatus Omnitrophica bacterium]|nr:MAG: hypothetical protein A2Z81_09205 [Omnitrophica WOR_2 bacterium GWA2_45_18]HBR15330.1 hypothetical protein [Candidatus Omnitrophota bacterium]